MANTVQSPEGVVAAGSRSHIWKRGALMLLFAILFTFATTALFLIALGQFLWLAITLRNNEYLAGFGGSLAQWLAAAGRYLSCQSDDRPFPWTAWPQPQT